MERALKGEADASCAAETSLKCVDYNDDVADSSRLKRVRDTRDAVDPSCAPSEIVQRSEEFGINTQRDNSSEYISHELPNRAYDGTINAPCALATFNSCAATTLEDMVSQQGNDDDIRPILQMKRNCSVKPSWDEVAPLSPVAKALWQQWEQLCIRDNVLYRRFEYGDGRPDVYQMIIPFQFRETIFRDVHEGIAGGHMGRKRTEDQIQRRAYWPGWTSDIRLFLRRCKACAQYRRGGPPKATPLKPMIVGDVWERVSIDVTGPHPKSRRGNCYIITIVDHFSKWSDAFPTYNHNATTIAKILCERVFATFGLPLQLLSDRGSEFESSLMLELCRWLDIEKLRTTAYKPSTNGIVERYHRSLNTIMAKIITDDQRNWCEKVPIAAAAYRSSAHEVTGYSPNFLIFGRENRAPVDVNFNAHDIEENEVVLDEFVDSRRKMMREVYSIVRQRLGVAANRRKNYYDTNVKPSHYKVGTWVWYLYNRRRTGLSPKWQKNYTGPYLIIKIISQHNLVLQKSRRSKPFTVHKDKVKTFFGDPPVSWITASGETTDVVEETDKPPIAIQPIPNAPTMPTIDGERNVDEGFAREKAGDPGSRHCFPTFQPPSSYTQPNCDLPPVDCITDSRRLARMRNKPPWLRHYACGVFSSSKMSGQPSITCRIPGCGRCFIRRDSLRRHLARCHPRDRDVTVEATRKTTNPGQLTATDNRTVVASNIENARLFPITESQQLEVGSPCIRATFSVPSRPTVITDEMLMEAADFVVAAGPQAPSGEVMLKLTAAPYFLPTDVARGVIVGARVAACNLGNCALQLISPLQLSNTTWSRGIFKNINLWSKEPEFGWSVTNRSTLSTRSVSMEEMSTVTEAERDSMSSSRYGTTEESWIQPIATASTEATQCSNTGTMMHGDKSTRSDQETSNSQIDTLELVEPSMSASVIADIVELLDVMVTPPSNIRPTDALQSLTSTVDINPSERATPTLAQPDGQREENGQAKRKQSRMDKEDTCTMSQADQFPSLNGSSSTPIHHGANAREGTVVINGRRGVESWRIVLRPSVRNMIIADSNLRRARHIPPHWEVQVYPGAHIHDTVKLIESIDLSTKNELQRVVIQVGINNRSERVPARVVESIIRCARAKGIVPVFVGVAVSPGLRRHEMENLRDLNRMLNDSASHFIHPLDEDDVHIDQNDRHGIHHNQATVDRVIESVVNYVNATFDVGDSTECTPYKRRR